MTRLFELTEQYQQVWNLVENEEIDLTMLEDTLAGIEGAIEVKAINIVQFIRSLESDAEIIKAEEKRLAERRKALENKRDGIKKYLQMQLEAAGMEKVKTPTITLALQNNPPSVKVISEEGIPAKYWVQQAPVLDKKAILQDLKSGIEVIGVELHQGKSLRIR